MRKIAERVHPKQSAAIQSCLAKVNVVDQARVAEVQREIREGRFQVNSDIVAKRLLEVAKEMLTVHRA